MTADQIRTQAAALVDRTTKAQRIPRTVVDPAALRRVAHVVHREIRKGTP